MPRAEDAEPAPDDSEAKWLPRLLLCCSAALLPSAARLRMVTREKTGEKTENPWTRASQQRLDGCVEWTWIMAPSSLPAMTPELRQTAQGHFLEVSRGMNVTLERQAAQWPGGPVVQ